MQRENKRMRIGDRMRNLRLEFGKRLKDVSMQTGISMSSICRIESNEVQPDASDVTAYCEVFGVTHKWLLTGDGVKFSRDEKKPGGESLARVADEVARVLKSTGIVEEYNLAGEDEREKMLRDIQSLLVAYNQIKKNV
jgi:transcriptional regulator with XRE-family HTH domain